MMSAVPCKKMGHSCSGGMSANRLVGTSLIHTVTFVGRLTLG